MYGKMSVTFHGENAQTLQNIAPLLAWSDSSWMCAENVCRQNEHGQIHGEKYDWFEKHEVEVACRYKKHIASSTVTVVRI